MLLVSMVCASAGVLKVPSSSIGEFWANQVVGVVRGGAQ